MIDTARQRRAQQVEAKYAADLRRLRQAKEDDLQELNERLMFNEPAGPIPLTTAQWLRLIIDDQLP